MTSQQTTRIKGKASGVFTNPSGGTTTGIGTNNFTWGVGVDGSPPNSISFIGKPFDTALPLGSAELPTFDRRKFPLGYTYGKRQDNRSEIFSLGTLSYFNGTTESGTEASSIRLDITTEVTSPVGTEPKTFNYGLELINRTNVVGDSIASADSVRFPIYSNDVILKTPSGAPLTLALEGVGGIQGNGFYTQDSFFVEEGKTAQGELIGRFADPIESIVEGAVTVELREIKSLFPFERVAIYAEFTPNKLTLKEAAALGGYAYFNWYSLVTDIPRYQKGIGPYYSVEDSSKSKPLMLPIVDPPEGGWSHYKGVQKSSDNLPFYHDETGQTNNGILETREENEINLGKTLRFEDRPQSSNLKKGEFLEFETSLVGVFPDESWQALYTFRWRTNYTGKGGGVEIFGTSSSANSQGTGGIFDLQLNLNPADIPAAVRRQMEADGARNASGAAATPPDSIDFSGKNRGRNRNGTNRSNKMSGTRKNDIIKGRGGNDRIFGKGGNDQLEGGNGNDKLSGGNGNDVLIGNSGNDILTGGKGNDLFTFTQINDGIDTIKDFTPGVDLIDLREIFASSAFAGVDIVSRFTEFLQVVSLGADSQVQIDADGAGSGTDFITLATLKNVAVDDITPRSFVIV